MLAAITSLVTLLLTVFASIIWFRRYRTHPETAQSARAQLVRHTRYAVGAALAGALTSAALLTAGKIFATIPVLVLIFTLAWPAAGASGHLLALNAGWPTRHTKLPWKKLLLLALALVSFGQIMRITVAPQLSDELTRLAAGLDTNNVLVALGFLAFMLLMAVYEEIIFRQFLLPWMKFTFSRFATEGIALTLAVIANCTLFALWHADMLTPVWMKPTQTFIYGLAFCWARITYGTRAAIVAHVALNSLAIITTLLIEGISS